MTLDEIKKLIKLHVGEFVEFTPTNDHSITSLALEFEKQINLTKHQEQVRLVAVFKIWLEGLSNKFAGDGNMDAYNILNYISTRVELILGGLQQTTVEAQEIPTRPTLPAPPQG